MMFYLINDTSSSSDAVLSFQLFYCDPYKPRNVCNARKQNNNVFCVVFCVVFKLFLNEFRSTFSVHQNF